MTEKEITRANALRMMDIRTLPNGKPQIFSIKYVEIGGKLRYVDQCTIGGAGRMDNQEKRMRGITPCDCKGAPIDHVHPVRIDNILELNHLRVVSVLTNIKFKE